jgi:hypothetical protein
MYLSTNANQPSPRWVITKLGVLIDVSFKISDNGFFEFEILIKDNEREAGKFFLKMFFFTKSGRKSNWCQVPTETISH